MHVYVCRRSYRLVNVVLVLTISIRDAWEISRIHQGVSHEQCQNKTSSVAETMYERGRLYNYTPTLAITGHYILSRGA